MQALQCTYPGTSGDAHYLRILHLAASTHEHDVQTALELLLDAGQVPQAERVKELVRPVAPSIPAMAVPPVDLALYDTLLGEVLS